MLFNTPTFILYFLPLVLVIHWISPRNIRNIILLVFSLVFYAAGEFDYLWLLTLSIIVNWFLAILIEKYKSKTVLFLSFLFNIGLLVFFKYFYFLINSLGLYNYFIRNFSLDLKAIHLPIGISFFTFQAISYLLDVFNNKVISQKNLINFGVYLSFFPQLIAGPIVRYKDFYRQLEIRLFCKNKFTRGAERFILGLAKKMILANSCGELSSQIFGIEPVYLHSLDAWLGMFVFSLQIYFDFSGYTDMAIGIGWLLGFDIMENFNYPYTAISFSDFWKRWHISLSNFFRDYLYIPLGGNRVSDLRTYLNLIIVFVITGLWHGSKWHFIFWGLYHALIIILEKIINKKYAPKINNFLASFFTFILVSFGWIIFSFDNLSNIMEYFLKLLPFISISKNIELNSIVYSFDNIILILVGFIIATKIHLRIKNMLYSFIYSHWSIKLTSLFDLSRAFLNLVFVFLCSLKLAANTYNPFIYFRF